MICFWLYDKNIIYLFDFWRVGLFVVKSFVFHVSLHSIFANIVVDHLCLVMNILDNPRGRNECLLWTNAQFYIKDIIRNASMEHSAWLTADAFVIRNVINKDRNADVFLPQWSSLTCFNANACLIDAWDRSSMLIVCVGFVLACCRVKPRTPTTSLNTCDTKADPLSEKSVIGE